ncbi:MAG: LLM class flavin-dependent oxidoreductase, partial [Chloroflexota bacterium]
MSRRKIGLGLAGSGDVRDAIVYAREAERLGYDSVWLHESYFERDAITYLTAMATELRTIRLGAGALNPYTRHPVVIAMTMSALDDLAPDRVSLALGSALPLRLQQMGIHYGDTVAEVSKTIDQLRALWSGERLALNPSVPPLQAMFAPPHHIPISIAGYQGRFLDLCGEKADGYLARPAESIPALRLMRERIRRSAEQHGRDPDSIEFRGYVLALVGDTRRAALNRAKREPFVIYMMSVLSDVSLKRAGFPPELRNEIGVAWRAEDFHKAGGLIPDELLDAFLACGTRDDVAQKVLEYHRAGLDVPLIQPILQEESQARLVLQAGAVFANGGLEGATPHSQPADAPEQDPVLLPDDLPVGRRLWRHSQA